MPKHMILLVALYGFVEVCLGMGDLRKYDVMVSMLVLLVFYFRFGTCDWRRVTCMMWAS